MCSSSYMCSSCICSSCISTSCIYRSVSASSKLYRLVVSACCIGLLYVCRMDYNLPPICFAKKFISTGKHITVFASAPNDEYSGVL